MMIISRMRRGRGKIFLYISLRRDEKNLFSVRKRGYSDLDQEEHFAEFRKITPHPPAGRTLIKTNLLDTQE